MFFGQSSAPHAVLQQLKHGGRIILPVKARQIQSMLMTRCTVLPFC
ncbi:hypothetical protein HY497_01210 [Candidatus Woesearchaeota archaeon]|nr:hypothetical protein [Candidatus Woesearchaeota archaeon]